MTPIGNSFEHCVVALERSRLGCFVQSGLKAICGTLRVVGPFGGDQLGALRRAAVDQHHVGMLGVNLVEAIPDQAMVVEVEATGEGDFRSWRQQ